MRPGLITRFSLILIGAAVVQADDPPALFPIRQNGNFGYINAAGEIVIAPRFLRVGLEARKHFVEDLEAVWVDDKAGYIDASGKILIAPQFGQAQSFSEGLAAVRAGEAPWKWGYIDKTGRFLIPPQFDDAYIFSDGLALVVVSGQAGYIDKSGSFVVPPQYRSYSPEDSTFSDGLACVEIDGRWGFISKEGKLVIEAQFGGPSSFHEGLAVAQVGEKFSTRFGFIDKTGKLAIAPRFSLAWRFSEGLARVQDKATMAFIDKTGAVVFTMPNAKWADEFSEGLVNVRIGAHPPQEKWGYVDREGKWAIEPRFQKGEPFYKGLARVIVENKIAYINKTGRFAWGPDSGNEALAAKLRADGTPEEWRKNQEELLRLATLIDPANPLLTEQSLQSGKVPVDALQKLAADGSKPAEQLLERLLSYAPNPALMELSPDMAAMQQSEIQAQAARALIALGDSFVLPTLRRWLSDALKSEVQLDPSLKATTGCAVEGLKQFRDDVSVAPLEALLKSAAIDRWTRETILLAIADFGLPQSKPTLVGAMENPQVGEHIRCAAAAALVRIGEPSGRRFLLETYELYLDSLRKRSSEHGYSRSELEFLGDAELIKSLEARAAAETPGIPRNNITTLLPLMRVSGMSLEELKEVASQGGIDLRLHAIAMIGRQGGVDLIPFLESLRAAPDAYPKRSVNDWNNLLRNAAIAAIRQIRMRHSR